MFQARKTVLLGAIAAVGVVVVIIAIVAIREPVLLGFATASTVDDTLTNSTVVLSEDELEQERLDAPSKQE